MVDLFRKTPSLSRANEIRCLAYLRLRNLLLTNRRSFFIFFIHFCPVEQCLSFIRHSTRWTTPSTTIFMFQTSQYSFSTISNMQN